MFSRGCRENIVALPYQKENAIGMHDTKREKKPNQTQNQTKLKQTNKNPQIPKPKKCKMISSVLSGGRYN